MRPSSALLVAIAWLGAAHAESPGRQTYCCTDERGQRICGDILPFACYNRGYSIINERGVTVRRVDPPLTDEQRARKQAEDKRAAEQRHIRLEQERRDRALLDAYASADEIDALRTRVLRDLQADIDRETAQRAEALRMKKTLDQEMEFYRKNPAPKELVDAVSANAATLRAHAAVIESKRKEMDAVRLRYDEDKRRYLELDRRRQDAARTR